MYGLIPIYDLPAVPVSTAELSLLTDAARGEDWSVSNESHPTRRRTARVLARKGLFTLLEGASTGWEPDMWAAALTCPGWNTIWRANGERHVPGCGSDWLPDGSCSGCGIVRRLDAEAFDEYLEATTSVERAFLSQRTRLWCDEHGFARDAQWTTTKTCGQAGSPYHERNFFRV